MKKLDHKMTVQYKAPEAIEKIKLHMRKLIQQGNPNLNRPIVLLCIGSDRYTGDSLGPLVGSQLSGLTDSFVYGNLDDTVHAGNLIDTVEEIEQTHSNPLIIAIDACLGRQSEVGNIEIWEGGLRAGIAVGNNLPRVGHISIIGVVNAGSPVGYLDLQTTPLSLVMKISKVIGCAMLEVLEQVEFEHKGIVQAAAAKADE